MGFLLPMHCGGCGRRGWAMCPRCVAEFQRAPPGPTPVGLDSCRGLLCYTGRARTLVGGLKYANDRSAVAWLAEGLAGLVPAGGQLVTWAPTAPARRRQRGYDQAELLARALARRLGLPVRRTLKRCGPGVAQTGLDRAARLANPRFEALADVSGLAVVLVDDVLTTGATLASAGLTLRMAGASTVHGVTVAATPDEGAQAGPMFPPFQRTSPAPGAVPAAS